ncbi:hypothetical protein [Tissierella sp.]|uniref:hypothetical protein n=1 Tax=Tissierella sp. TaxID=41274 RepID=UPI00285B99E8|nr:hypothetical protein [Tissierella sp.]MDR7855624.1 hypothetical protein [Tissierella sp.]
MANPLSRVAMGNIIKDKSSIISPRLEGNGSNLDNKENELIFDIIKGTREVAEIKTKNASITLEEAANRIKNNR